MNDQLPENILELRGLKTHYPIRGGVFRRTVDSIKAVDGVDLSVRRGEVLGLVGESGCGKSTLGKSILRLALSTAGEIVFSSENGEVDLRQLTRAELFPYRRRLQIIFQDPHSSLNPAFTIFTAFDDVLKRYGYGDKEARRAVLGDLFEAVNMPRHYIDRYPHEFSGGQRQRIGIARALAVDPELIVCDEPVSALDASIQAQVLKLLQNLRQERNLTYIFITHDLSVTEYFCDRIAVMYLGKIVEIAKSEEIFGTTLHPYTQALISAIPVADLDRKSKRIVLEGDVPSPVSPPSGCAFHPRCRFATDICRQQTPKLQPSKDYPKDHLVACHRVEELGVLGHA
ncbi:MAG: ABC transporter ATP-binding protein [Planctomycetales bacterium]|nr:ABC transporter ATP-binding protein [Planctomycetales bacterium]MCC0024407.1 ABC transporter ATP-binding protein [Hyphomicrobiaceae bacterium]